MDDVKRLARSVGRRVSSRQRGSKTLEYILCAVVMVLGIGFLVTIMRGWFVAF